MYSTLLFLRRASCSLGMPISLPFFPQKSLIIRFIPFNAARKGYPLPMLPRSMGDSNHPIMKSLSTIEFIVVLNANSNEWHLAHPGSDAGGDACQSSQEATAASLPGGAKYQPTQIPPRKGSTLLRMRLFPFYQITTLVSIIHAWIYVCLLVHFTNMFNYIEIINKKKYTLLKHGVSRLNWFGREEDTHQGEQRK